MRDILDRGKPGQFKGKKRKSPAKGKGIKGRLSTRLIFRATPLYQDHVCYSPLGTTLVKIHASYFYNEPQSFVEWKEDKVKKSYNVHSIVNYDFSLFLILTCCDSRNSYSFYSVIINILLVTFNTFSPTIVGLRSQSVVRLIYLIKQLYIYIQ